MLNKKIPDCIFYNGHMITMDKKIKGSALSVCNGKIGMVADDMTVLGTRGFGTRLVNLEGKTVVPGFIDCNVHTVQNGLSSYCIHVGASQKADFIEKLSKITESYSEGELIWCVGYEDDSLNRWELDKISTRHPIIVSGMEFHATCVNTFAYNMLALPLSIPGIQKDSMGRPTGILKGEASGFARRKMNQKFVDDRLRRRAASYTVMEAAKYGITTMNAMEGGAFFSDKDIEAVSQFSKYSPVELLIFPQIMETEEAAPFGRIGGNIYIDGTIGSKTAAVFGGYADDAKNGGMLYFTQEELNGFIGAAHERGLQIAVSCIGDRAIDMALNAFETAFLKWGLKNHRHRIEFFVLPGKAQIKKAVALGIIISVRPNYDSLWGGKDGMYAKHIGQRYKNCNPIQSIIKAGGIVAGGSEAPVTPLNPMLGIAGAVGHSQMSERVSVYEALKMYTVNAAYANFIENRAGRLTPGCDADLAVLDKNPLAADPKKISEIKTVMTVKKGNVIYG